MPSHRRFREWIWVVALLAAAAASTGCRVTSEDIDAWKGTVKGPKTCSYEKDIWGFVFFNSLNI